MTFGSPIDTAVIETRSLTKRYGRTGRDVSDLDLDVLGGEVFGFLGPDGAGKTTPSGCSSIIRPTSGEARIGSRCRPPAQRDEEPETAEHQHGACREHRHDGYWAGRRQLAASLPG